MKKINLFAGMAIIALGFSSCKSETEKQAEVTFDGYESYVDSVSNFEVAEAKANWAAIEADYNARTAEAEAALANMADKENAQNRLEKSKEKYAELKAKLDAEMAAETPVADATATNPNRKQVLRDSYFGAGKIGEDMSFAWVNKDNIVSVYQNFYDTFDKNKDSYSREDFDEIKAMYEALDAHKNTVEKQGLTSENNGKIASIKLKFAPKFKWERIGAKADENQAAKQ